MPETLTLSLADKIRSLKKTRNAVLVAHNYQIGEIQELADYLGDSLGMAKFAAQAREPVILVCGVHFMAESAALLNPNKTILIPDLEAGCSLSECITADQLRAWKSEHPGAAVVAYVNTSAEVKAESDVCCTSSNALKIVESFPPEREILFVPDMYLGQWVRSRSQRKIHLWNGSCHTHVRIRSEPILQLKQQHPKAEFLMHPECGCLTACMHLADKILSTDGIIQRAHESSAKEFIIATETGILHRLNKENPGKKFYPAAPEATCEFMKKNTLEKVLWSLEDLRYRVTVPEETAQKARQSLERMMAIS
ncbi:MAG: quinolinate synthase NadA [Elusimicrobia bacterium]|nr:quinolinate synthase NadA [Elusimicrobiota bacterium]MBI2916306.1 quinolinate synthase NadA [Elusimicrobiota bacterium]MBI3013215.1 quinolinate synthase NadA [Elusimicrobiota bacterium]MBI4217671.1 quinolinate synthase NadA [Elusimicrobiota bacterium]